jgi:hypothetical protein
LVTQVTVTLETLLAAIVPAAAPTVQVWFAGCEVTVTL